MLNINQAPDRVGPPASYLHCAQFLVLDFFGSVFIIKGYMQFLIYSGFSPKSKVSRVQTVVRDRADASPRLTPLPGQS